MTPSYAQCYACVPIDDPEFKLDMFLVYRADNANPVLPALVRELRDLARGLDAGEQENA